MLFEDKTVSVVIPTYNRAAMLARALRSVYGQTRLPDEIIVVDDGSDDDTAQIVATAFPTVKYIRQENQGVSAARNRGIQTAQGQWIALLDSDDEWLPQKLEKQFALLEQNPTLRLCHSEEIWMRCGRRVNPMKKHAKADGWIFRQCLPLCAISPSSIVIHRSVFADVGLFDETLPACEDYDLWLRMTARYPVLLAEEPLIVKYGGHEDQLSRKYWGMDRFRIRALEKILRTDSLSPENERAARAMLLEKARIYLSGARKRHKQAEVHYYQSLCRRYAA